MTAPGSMDKPAIRVVAAVIVRDGRILLTQRSPSRDYPFFWECPGGKIDAGEAPADALLRELEEELMVMADEVDVDAEPLFWTVLEPPETDGRVELAFLRVREHSTVMPECVDVEGFGWFTMDEMSRLSLIPGNVRLFYNLKANGGLPYSSRTQR